MVEQTNEDIRIGNKIKKYQASGNTEQVNINQHTDIISCFVYNTDYTVHCYREVNIAASSLAKDKQASL